MKKIFFYAALFALGCVGNAQAMYQTVQLLIADKAPISRNDQSDFSIGSGDGDKIRAAYYPKTQGYVVDQEYADGCRVRWNSYIKQQDDIKKIYVLLETEFARRGSENK